MFRNKGVVTLFVVFITVAVTVASAEKKSLGSAAGKSGLTVSQVRCAHIALVLARLIDNEIFWRKNCQRVKCKGKADEQHKNLKL